MTKRTAQFSNNLQNKRQKRHEDIDDLWGEDLDETVLDDCFKVCESLTQQNPVNESVLPSYNGFKESNNRLLSSTQLSFISESSSTNKNALEDEIKALKQIINDKDGEVVYLRGEIKKFETTLEQQAQKIQNQWKEKFSVTENDLKAIKTQLEFKNLEIANLKQKNIEVQKCKLFENKPNVKNRKIKREAILHTFYPLKCLKSTLFNREVEKYQLEPDRRIKVCRNTIPYLQNQRLQSLSSIENSKFRSLLTDKSELLFDYVHCDVFYLVNCSNEELDLKANLIHINKVVCASIQLLSDFHNYLTILRHNIKVEHIQKNDTLYLERKINYFNNVECGIHVGKCLYVIAELLLFNDYVRNYVCRKKMLIFNGNEEFLHNFPVFTNQQFNEPFYYLNLILKIVTLIGEIRKSHATSKFLHSVVKLLTNICKSNEYENVSHILCNITKELIFSRPNGLVVEELTILLKVASQYNSFMVFLFSKPNNIKMELKQGIINFKKDSCRFYMFVILFENTLYMLQTEQFSWSVCLNMLSFVYNSYKFSFNSHYTSVKPCECLSQLTKLIVEVSYRAIEKFGEETKNIAISDSCKYLFINEIIKNVLHLMTVISYENIAKYVSVYAQFKEIEQKLNEFETLNLSEEIPSITPDRFENINFL